jgi:cell division protease FtsH
MVVRFGMVPKLGQVAYEPESGSFLVGQMPVWRPRTYGDATAVAIDTAVKELIDAAFQRACDILKRNRSGLEASARELLKRETLNQNDLSKLTTGLDRGTEAKPLAAAE